MFGGSQAETKPATAVEESQPAALRGSKTEVATAKPKQHSIIRSASAGEAQPKPAQAQPQPQAQPKQVAAASAPEPAPAPKPRVIPIEKKETPAPERDMRTAFSAPPPSNGLLTGAQPVVPAGTFDNRFSGLR
jgi:hypothetical protein